MAKRLTIAQVKARCPGALTIRPSGVPGELVVRWRHCRNRADHGYFTEHADDALDTAVAMDRDGAACCPLPEGDL